MIKKSINRNAANLSVLYQFIAYEFFFNNNSVAWLFYSLSVYPEHCPSLELLNTVFKQDVKAIVLISARLVTYC